MKNITLCIIILIMTTITLKSQEYECYTSDIITPASTDVSNPCGDYLKYIPDGNTSLLEVKINYHFFRNDNGTGIFQPSDSAIINQTTDWINWIYRNLSPPTITVIPPASIIPDSKISFKVTGVYYHDDSEYYSRNNAICSNDFYKNFSVDKNSVINIFFYLDPAYTGGGGCPPLII